jgi:hypothetical protein
MKYQTTRSYTKEIRTMAAALIVAAVVPVSWGQEEAEEEAIIRSGPPPEVIEIENDAVVEAGKAGEIRFFRGVGAPEGVEVISPDDDEIVLDTKPRRAAPPVGPTGPKPPRIVRKVQVGPEGGDEMARRLERLESKLEALTERERMMRRENVALNEKQLARVQREVERAAREADVAIRKFQFAHPGGEEGFAFEHRVAVAGSAKAQRKALEAQRKALEKQLEAIDRRLEEMTEEEEKDSKEGEVEPTLPPESAP